MQPLEADSIPDRMLLSIITNRPRRTSLSRTICYATLLSSSSRATLQLSKQFKIATDHPSNTPILTIWKQSQRYKDQQIQTKQLNICIYPHSLHRLCQVQMRLFLQGERCHFLNPQSIYHITLAVFFYYSTTTTPIVFLCQSSLLITFDSHVRES